MIQIVPAILVEDEQQFLEQVRAVEELVPLVQIDVADGEFVPHTTWADPDVIADKLTIDCELHLMVADPLAAARLFEDVPQVKRIIVHYESAPDMIRDIIPQIQSYGWDVCVALNPETSIDVLKEMIEDIDGVQYMGIKPGAQGQPFIPEVLEKIRTSKTRHPNLFVEVDGGVNEETLPEVVASGADALVIGSAIFGNDRTPKENIERIKEKIDTLLHG